MGVRCVGMLAALLLLFACSEKSEEEKVKWTLAISELCYKPVLGDSLEFVEIKNYGDVELPMAGVQISGGIDFLFPENAEPLGPDSFLVVPASRPHFAALYPEIPTYGSYQGNLSNSGEKISLKNPEGKEIFEMEYGDGKDWPLLADFSGHCLNLVEVENPKRAASWQASHEPGGTPGENNVMHRPTIAIERVEVNEGFGAKIFLQNLQEVDVNLKGWVLSSERGFTSEFVIAEEFVLAAKSLKMIGNVAAENTYEIPYLSLSQSGGELFFGKRLANGEFAEIIGVKYLPDVAGGLQGWKESSGGLKTWFYLNSEGEPRDLGKTLMISELHYHPTEDLGEFLELKNTSEESISIFGKDSSEKFYKIAGVDLRFQKDLTVPSGGLLILVNEDEEGVAGFKEKHSLNDDVQVVSYGGKLSNGGEMIAVQKKEWEPDSSAFWRTVDLIDYTDAEPWPVEADGDGKSLHRKSFLGLALNPQDWMAGVPSPGKGGADVE